MEVLRGGLHTPNRNRFSDQLHVLSKHPLLLWLLVRAQVGNHQVSRLRPAAIHVGHYLLSSLPGQEIQADFLGAYLTPDDELAGVRRALVRALTPFNQQIRALASQSVLPPDPSATVHHAVPIYLQN